MVDLGCINNGAIGPTSVGEFSLTFIVSSCIMPSQPQQDWVAIDLVNELPEVCRECPKLTNMVETCTLGLPTDALKEATAQGCLVPFSSCWRITNAAHELLVALELPCLCQVFDVLGIERQARANPFLHSHFVERVCQELRLWTRGNASAAARPSLCATLDLSEIMCSTLDSCSDCLLFHAMTVADIVLVSEVGSISTIIHWRHLPCQHLCRANTSYIRTFRCCSEFGKISHVPD
mmetsp:Transcript_96427/g.171447  ORF Transcript_96427/g.171447 Transcript_96427/m.171447 type:complete len:235 (+) Transcript_96427:809-1513(+)